MFGGQVQTNLQKHIHEGMKEYRPARKHGDIIFHPLLTFLKSKPDFPLGSGQLPSPALCP